MANENQDNRSRDVLITLTVVGGMIAAVMYFGKAPTLSRTKLVGSQAPEIEYEDNSGKMTKLTKQRGEVVLINFWASWCDPCMQEMPSLHILEDHFSKKGFLLLAFNIEEIKENLTGKIEPADMPENLIFNFNKENLRPYGVHAIPLSVLIDRNGIVREVVSGPKDWMEPGMIREIEGLLQ